MQPDAVLALLRRRLAEGDAAGARVLCEGFFRSRPDLRDEAGHPVYAIEALRIALAAGDRERAEALVVEFQASLAPGDPLLPVLLAQHHAARGEHGLAEERWRDALAVDHACTEARAALFGEADIRRSATSPPSPPTAAAATAPALPLPPTTVRTGDHFDGTMLPQAADLAAFCRDSEAIGAADTGFVHAASARRRVPSDWLHRGTTLFGPGRHLDDDSHARAAAVLPRIESVSLADAVFAPDYCLVFSQRLGLYAPSAGPFANRKNGARDLAAVYPAFAVGHDGHLQMPGFDALPHHDGIAVPICGMGFPDYAHFLFDGLGMALFWAEQLGREQVHLVGKPLRPWQAEVLERLGWLDRYLSLLAPHRFRRLIVSNQVLDHVTSPTRTARLAFDRLRLRLGTAHAASPKRLLVLREEAAPKRRLANRAALLDWAAAEGFTVVAPERTGFAERARLFAGAELVVGESGPGLADIGFCEPGTPVLEIAPETFAAQATRGACLILGLPWHLYVAESQGTAPDDPYEIDLPTLTDAVHAVGGGISAPRPAPPSPPAEPQIDTLPRGLSLGELASAGTAGAGLRYDPGERLPRHLFLHAEPIDGAIARFGSLFQDPRSCTYATPPVQIRPLAGATVLGSSGLVACQGKAVPDSLQSLAEWRRDSLVAAVEAEAVRLKRGVALPGRRIAEPCFHPFTGAWTDYAHWMIECMPKLPMFRWLRGQVPGLKLLLPHLPPRGFQERSLELLGISPGETIRLAADEVVAPEALWLAPTIGIWTPPSFTGRAADEMVRAAIGSAAMAAPGHERVYLRRTAAPRQMTGFAETAPVLEAFGFTVLSFEGLPLDEHIRTMQQARYVIGETDGLLCSILFARPGTRLLEIFGPAQPQLMHWSLASLRGVEYGYMVGRHQPDDGTTKPGMNTDYRITPDQLTRAIEVLLRT